MKNRKIAICQQRFDGSPGNLVWRCTFTLLNVSAVKRCKFVKPFFYTEPSTFALSPLNVKIAQNCGFGPPEPTQ